MLLPFGNLLTKGDIFISIIPNRLSPITRINEDKMIIQYGPEIDVKTLPVMAQIIPTTDKTTDKPKTKDVNWMNVLNLSLSPYPPT